MASELGIIVEVFGPLPLALGPDEASVFRTIEIFNNKWSGLTRRNSWTDKWAAPEFNAWGSFLVEQVKSTGGRGG